MSPALTGGFLTTAPLGKSWKVCFILAASNREKDGLPFKGRLLPHPPTPATDNQWARAFIDRGRGLRAETEQSARIVILKLVVRWSDLHCLDCFKYSSSPVPGSVCSHFLEASSWNSGSLSHGYSLVIM